MTRNAICYPLFLVVGMVFAYFFFDGHYESVIGSGTSSTKLYYANDFRKSGKNSNAAIRTNSAEEVFFDSVDLNNRIRSENKSDHREGASGMNANTALIEHHRELQGGRLKTHSMSTRGAAFRKIWISMSVCFGENTELHNKRHYPYAAVTPLSVLLWRHFAPSSLGVLVRVVYGRQKTFMNILQGYASTLERAGATVELVPVEDGDDCPLMSQLYRLVAFTNELVDDDDVVLTVDVNAFVMTSNILDPITRYPRLLAWVYQYHDTAHIDTGKGETFNQNFIAMRAKDWRAILEVGERTPFSMTSWLDERVETLGLDRSYTWYYDQWMTTLGLLKHRLCTVPPRSALWKNEGFSLQQGDFDDADSCFHGYGYKDCNKMIRIVYEGCKWWHFFPHEGFQAHLDKFHELTGNQYELEVVDPFQKDQGN